MTVLTIVINNLSCAGAFATHDGDSYHPAPFTISTNLEPRRIMAKITFVKEKKTIEVAPGTNLRKAALENGVQVYWGFHKNFPFNCLGFGHCGSCNVLITKGEDNVSQPGLWERFRILAGPLLFFWRIGNEKQLRLSCRCQVNGDVEVETTPTHNWHGERFWG